MGVLKKKIAQEWVNEMKQNYLSSNGITLFFNLALGPQHLQTSKYSKNFQLPEGKLHVVFRPHELLGEMMPCAMLLRQQLADGDDHRG